MFSVVVVFYFGIKLRLIWPPSHPIQSHSNVSRRASNNGLSLFFILPLKVRVYLVGTVVVKAKMLMSLQSLPWCLSHWLFRVDSPKPLFAIIGLLFSLFVHLQLRKSGSKDFVIFVSIVMTPILNSFCCCTGFSLKNKQFGSIELGIKRERTRTNKDILTSAFLGLICQCSPLVLWKLIVTW